MSRTTSKHPQARAKPHSRECQKTSTILYPRLGDMLSPSQNAHCGSHIPRPIHAKDPNTMLAAKSFHDQTMLHAMACVQKISSKFEWPACKMCVQRASLTGTNEVRVLEGRSRIENRECFFVRSKSSNTNERSSTAANLTVLTLRPEVLNLFWLSRFPLPPLTQGAVLSDSKCKLVVGTCLRTELGIRRRGGLRKSASELAKQVVQRSRERSRSSGSGAISEVGHNKRPKLKFKQPS